MSIVSAASLTNHGTSGKNTLGEMMVDALDDSEQICEKIAAARGTVDKHWR